MVGQTSPEVLRNIVILQNRILEAGPDIDAIMQTVVRSVHELLNIEGAAIEILEGFTFTYRAVAGHDFANRLQHVYPLEGSLSGLCLSRNEVLLCEDCETDPRVNAELCRKAQVRSMVVAPLAQARLLTGTLKFMSSRPNAFNDDHRQLVDLISEFLVRALSQADEAHSHLRRFEVLANSLPNLAFIASGEGAIYWFNERWYEYTGTTLEECLNEGWKRTHDPLEVDRVVEKWHNAIALEIPFEMMFPIRRFDGQFRWFLTRAVPIKDRSGRTTHWFGTNTDVHDQHKATLEMSSARDQAERASRLKTAFLANMSHEIRTPLGVIIGFADLLGASDIQGEDKDKYVAILKRNGEQLGRLINDILDLSKVESGLVDFEFRLVDPAEIAREVISFMNVKARTKNLELTFHEDGTCPRAVVTDSGRVRQILINLVDNAIKFTDAGKVTLGLSGSADGHCAFTVQDSGIGITKDSAERLFKMFNQADESMTRKYGGTGLGLALSRSLARAMGGDVALTHSQAGGGSLFTFSIQSADSLDTALGQSGD